MSDGCQKCGSVSVVDRVCVVCGQWQSRSRLDRTPAPSDLRAENERLRRLLSRWLVQWGELFTVSGGYIRPDGSHINLRVVNEVARDTREALRVG